MRSQLLLAVTLALSFSATARADMGTPGFSRVPHDFIFEVEAESPGYRFWLVSDRGVEPLDLAPGRPVRVDGAERTGSHRIAYVVAAQIGVIEGMGEEDFRKAFEQSHFPPGVNQSGHIDFLGQVPFYDSRERVVDRYRVEFSPGQPVRLVWLEQNEGSARVKAEWAAAGILAAVGFTWAGWWTLRRMWRVAAGQKPVA
jgi:hypothetical protein